VEGSELNENRSSPIVVCSSVQPDWYFNLLLLLKNIWIILFIGQWIG